MHKTELHLLQYMYFHTITRERKKKYSLLFRYYFCGNFFFLRISRARVLSKIYLSNFSCSLLFHEYFKCHIDRTSKTELFELILICAC